MLRVTQGGLCLEFCLPCLLGHSLRPLALCTHAADCSGVAHHHLGLTLPHSSCELLNSPCILLIGSSSGSGVLGSGSGSGSGVLGCRCSGSGSGSGVLGSRSGSGSVVLGSRSGSVVLGSGSGSVVLGSGSGSGSVVLGSGSGSGSVVLGSGSGKGLGTPLLLLSQLLGMRHLVQPDRLGARQAHCRKRALVALLGHLELA
jgi:hypothetical protein